MALRKRPEANKKQTNPTKKAAQKSYIKTHKREGDSSTKKFSKRGDERKSFEPKKTLREERKFESKGGKTPERKPFNRTRKEKPFEETRPMRKYSSSEKSNEKTPFKRGKASGGRDTKPRAYSSGHSRNNEAKSEYKKRENGATTRAPYNRFSKLEDDRKKPFRAKRENDIEREERPKTNASRFTKITDDRKPFVKTADRNDDRRNTLNRSTDPRAFSKSKTGFNRAGKTSDSKTNFEEKRTFKTDKKATGKSFDKLSKLREEESYNEFDSNDNIRLNRYVSNAGICSRREADKLISTGLVSVNGTVITEMGYQVKNGDDVRFNGQRLSREKKVYIIMNKPKDAITTLDDPDGRNTVMNVLGNELRERVFPIGRLDRNTTGVLLLTNDGELSQRLMHPKYEVEKVYKATLNKVFKGEDFWQMTNGLELEDGFIKPDEIAYPNAKTKMEVGVQIHSGRNRIIHRMFEHLDYLVDKLDRVSYGGFMKTGMKRGEWRHLNDKEVKKLKRLVKLG
jgi:23S rRNA pseudouridine2605 synthase